MRRRITKTFIISSVLAIAVFSLAGATFERALEVRLFQKEIDGYRHLLLKFLNQDWSIIALKNNASGTVTREIGHFVNSRTQCIRLYNKKKEVGSLGNCIAVPNNYTHNGWMSSPIHLVLRDDYRKGIFLEATLDNPEGYVVAEQSVSMPLKVRHVVAATKNIVLGYLLFAIVFWVYQLIVAIRRQREQSANQVHDYSNIAEDSLTRAEELVENADNPKAIKDIAFHMKSVGALRESVLYDGPADETRDINLGSLVDELIAGFFDVRDSSILEISEFDRNVWIEADKRHLFKSLSNLFDNAFREVVGKSKFTLTILESPKTVDFVVSNQGDIGNPKRLFQSGVSNRGSSGRGLAIVNETVSKMGSEICLTYGNDEVAFSFTLPKAMEKTCPALFA